MSAFENKRCKYFHAEKAEAKLQKDKKEGIKPRHKESTEKFLNKMVLRAE